MEDRLRRKDARRRHLKPFRNPSDQIAYHTANRNDLTREPRLHQDNTNDPLRSVLMRLVGLQ